MTNTKVQRDSVLSEEEVQGMIRKADEAKHVYFRLRSKCMVAILRRTGKRAGEINLLLWKDVKIRENGDIDLVFTLEKKRRKEVRLSRSPPKTILNSDPYSQYIKDYIDWVHAKFPQDPKYVFPLLQYLAGTLNFDIHKHLTRRTILKIVKRLDSKAWVHLFRETVGADIIQEDNTIIAPFKVQRRLDLENINSAFRYMTRYAKDVVSQQEIKKSEDAFLKNQAKEAEEIKNETDAERKKREEWEDE